MINSPNNSSNIELFELISQTKAFAKRYYSLTGRPLGVIGEIAEFEAARLLGLELAPVREPSVDATMMIESGKFTFQIKGRAVTTIEKYVGRVPNIKLQPSFDFCILVLIDKSTYEPIELWRATYNAIKARLIAPGSKSRNDRGSMGISQFKSIAERVWPPK